MLSGALRTAWNVCYNRTGCNGYHKVNVCRFCGNTVLPKLSVALFTKDGLDRDLPGRISSVVNLPVSREDILTCADLA